ncbi:MAG: peptidoglycan DD-metalloendopeptidase family protein [Actinomycetota bacterium]|nr:peptidoglycan DD-metalloendopeptidase family protein [Actinomycetota bacterium]
MAHPGHARLRVAATVTLVVALVCSLGGPVAAQSREERRLQQTRARIAQVRGQIEGAKVREAQSAASLGQAQQQLAAVLGAVAQAEQAVQRQQQAVQEARRRLAELHRAEAQRRQAMSVRAVTLYKRGTGAPLSAILAAGSPADMVDRSTYADLVARADQATVQGLSSAQTATDAQRRYLQDEEAALARVVEQQRALLAEVEALRNERALVLAASTAEVQQLQAQERHLEAESRQVAALARRSSRPAAIGVSRSSRSGSTQLAAASAPVGGGGWTWPARGPVTSGYGRRWGRMHEGIDIGAGTGAPIVAARSGTVSYAGRMSGYGNMTLIDHGGGIVTAYAHQSRFVARPGQRVSAGQQIGAVGCTGSCTGPHLHFEVRVNGSPRDPMSYLP